ncbi:MAG: hypothetical protein ACOCV9_07970 [Marinilabiliaceae bacterium]
MARTHQKTQKILKTNSLMPHKIIQMQSELKQKALNHAFETEKSTIQGAE